MPLLTFPAHRICLQNLPEITKQGVDKHVCSNRCDIPCPPHIGASSHPAIPPLKKFASKFFIKEAF